MSRHEEIPVIEVSSVKVHEADSCNGCGGSEDLKRLSFRVGWNALSSIVWCKNCRAKVIHFLNGMEQDR